MFNPDFYSLLPPDKQAEYNKTIPKSDCKWTNGIYDPIKDLQDLKKEIDDIKEFATQIECENRDGAIKKEIDLGLGVKRTIWIKGCHVVEEEISIPKEILDELEDYLLK